MEKFKILPGILFSCYTVKLMVLGSNVSDAGILAILATLVVFIYNKSESEKIQALTKRIKEIEDKYSDYQKLQDSIQTSVASIKMAQGMRKVGQ